MKTLKTWSLQHIYDHIFLSSVKGFRLRKLLDLLVKVVLYVIYVILNHKYSCLYSWLSLTCALTEWQWSHFEGNFLNEGNFEEMNEI